MTIQSATVPSYGSAEQMVVMTRPGFFQWSFFQSNPAYFIELNQSWIDTALLTFLLKRYFNIRNSQGGPTEDKTWKGRGGEPLILDLICGLVPPYQISARKKYNSY